MQTIIQPSSISGTIFVPASKSSMQRACAAALVSRGESIIHNPGRSNDDRATLNVIRALGAEVTVNDQELIIKSNGVNPVSNIVNNGESGLGIRMFVPIVSLSENEMTINGDGSLLTRPMDFFDEVLPQLGVEIKSNYGKLPLKVKGPLQPANIEIDGSLSSQFLTGLLFAYSAIDAKDVSIKVNNLKSKPYVDLTLKVMKDFDLKVPQNKNYEEFYFTPAARRSSLSFHEYTVEGDWSGGAFLLVAGAIAGNIIVKGLDIHSTQADKKILEVLKDCGADIIFQNGTIKISNSRSSLKRFHFDATDCPDLFPPLAVLAAYCEGITMIEGVYRLTHKESNRALTIQEELGKMGVRIDLSDNQMVIHGNKKLKSAYVDSCHDHRIAMMCAVAALKAVGETTIDSAEAVNKSYPDFYKHLQKLGAAVSLSSQLIN